MGSMELAIPIESDLKEINIEGYQSKFLAIVKNGLAKSNPTLFRYLYTTAKPKLFATSVNFKNGHYENKKMVFDEEGMRATIYISTSNTQLAFEFYNAFITQHHKKGRIPFPKHKGFTYEVQKPFEVSTPEIMRNKAIFQTVSPLIVRTNSRKGLVMSDDNLDEYNQMLRRSLKCRLDKTAELLGVLNEWKLTESEEKAVDRKTEELKKLADTLKVRPIKVKKTIIKPFDITYAVTMGKFQIEGDPVILNYALQNGLGEKCGSFAGLCQLIKEA